MSDTSGRITWGAPKAAVNRNFYSTYPRSGSRGKTTSAADKKKGELSLEPSPAGKIVWNPLQKHGQLTEKAFAALVPYLKRMAEFIEIAASSGLPGVNAEFELGDEARFASLQRKIRSQVGSGATSEFDPPAGRAFQVGSTEWASFLLGKRDPTTFVVGKIVESVQQGSGRALVKSAERILEAFGKQILTSVLPGGQRSLLGVERVIQDFLDRLKNFMKTNSDAAKWSSRAIAGTTTKLVESLVRLET